MTETNEALLAGLPGDVRALLTRPPLDETRLLELTATWEGLTPAQARMAEALRLFVVTWDPLEWLAPRPAAVATANAWPFEIVVYVPVWSLAEVAGRRETTMAAVLAGRVGAHGEETARVRRPSTRRRHGSPRRDTSSPLQPSSLAVIDIV